MFENFNTHNDSHERAFEALCNQLFERWIYREYPGLISYFTTLNGSGGDGGVEAYAILVIGDWVGVQSKWYPYAVTKNQVGKIKASVKTALEIRPDLKRYIVCLPRNTAGSKKGKGGKSNGDTEEKRLNDLMSEVSIDHPGLRFEIWKKDRILAELQYPGNEGIRRYWFEKVELSVEHLRQRFELAKTSWLKERYVPDHHQMGQIGAAASEILFTASYREKEAEAMDRVQGRYFEAMELIDQYNQLAGTGNEFENDLAEMRGYLERSYHQLSPLKSDLFTGIDHLALPVIDILDVDRIVKKVREHKLANPLKNVGLRLRTSFERISPLLRKPTYANVVQEKNLPHNVLIFGKPGTGKTHGLAHAVGLLLNKGYPALLIQAVGKADSWAEILQNALGGLHTWTDAEIFNALEALAFRKDVERALEPDVSGPKNEPTHVLIGIDGVDESTNVKNWRLRIAEMEVWIKTCPRIRFAVTSRSYPGSNENPCKLTISETNRALSLPGDGDVPLSKLVGYYLKEYDINTEGIAWIEESFENALSLKLFCEQYKGKRIASLGRPVSTTLKQLLDAKMAVIQTEFYDKYSPVWSLSEQVILKAAINLAKKLHEVGRVEQETLCQEISGDIPVVDRAWAGKILDAFTDHGVLVREVEHGEGYAPAVVSYYASYQSYLDYLIAINASTEVVKKGTKDLPDILKKQIDPNILRLTATTLLSDHGILVGEHGYWTAEMDGNDLSVLQLEALSKAADRTIWDYMPFLQAKFLDSTRGRNAVLFRLVIPNLYRTGLDLGMIFLHRILNDFPDPFSRDLVWSVPEKFDNDDNENIGNYLEAFRLKPTHLHNDLPLVFGWSLASTHNEWREQAMRELTYWGYHRPGEFVKLLNLLFKCNDPQVQEDLATILHGIACRFEESTAGLKELANWASENIFAPGKIEGFYNAEVRRSARMLVERAFELGDCSQEVVLRASRPYQHSKKLLALDRTVAGSSEEEIYPIGHDLAWYVIKESYEGFLEKEDDQLTTVEAQALMKQYDEEYGLELNPYRFAMSAAIAYIKRLGFNRVDGNTMTEESHGGISKRATLEEKYTWLAVRMLQGYLADRVPFEEDRYGKGLLRDYNLLLYKANPADESLEDPLGPIGALREPWYIPHEISPPFTFSGKPKKADIKQWVENDSVPEFGDWIKVKELLLTAGFGKISGWKSLYMEVRLPERNNIGYTALTLVCCLISKGQLPKFVDLIKGAKRKADLFQIGEISRLMARTEGPTYASVKDVVLMRWLGEEENTVEWDVRGEIIRLHKTVTNVVEHTIRDGEDRYKVPAKMVRREMAINGSDKAHFFAPGKVLAALYYQNGNPGAEYQEFLVVDPKLFDDWIVRSGLVPIWLVHQFRRPTTDFSAANKDLHVQNSKQWLVWQQDGGFQSYLYHNDYFSN